MNNDYYIPPSSATVEEKTSIKPEYKIMDTVFAWLSVIIGFFFAKAFPIRQNTLGTLICIILLFVFATVYFKRSEIRFCRGSYLLLALAIIFAFGFITSGNDGVHAVLFMFVLAIFLYWIYFLSGLTGKKILGVNIVSHLWYSLFALPVLSIPHFFSGIIIRDKGGVGKKTMRSILFVFLGLWCAIIPTGIIIALLSYDDNFMGILENIFKSVTSSVGDILLGFIFAIFIFGVLFGVKFSSIKNEGGEQKVNKLKTEVLPAAFLCASVTPVLLVYVVFFISQWDYYMSAFTGFLPEGMTYAEYAREGFFQLCVICVINALMLLLFNILMKKSGKVTDGIKKGYSLIISLFTMVLIATALSKMMLYIGTYGLTRKRVYTSWLMVLLACVFIVVILGIFIKKIKIAPLVLCLFVVFFMLIALPDVDGMIAEYNVSAYISGELDSMDVDTLSEYGVSGVPALLRLEEHLKGKSELDSSEKACLTLTQNALIEIKSEISGLSDSVFTFNIPRYNAEKLLKEYK